MISNKQNFVIFPGISYTANGPSWIDRIQITADINGVPCDLYKMQDNGGINFSEAYNYINTEGHSIFNRINGEVIFVYNSEHDFSNFANLTPPSSAQGVCAAHFNGGYTDTLTFTLTLYTNTSWISKGEDELGFGRSGAAQLKEVGQMKVRYNPFIVLSLPPEIHEGEWVEQNVTFDFSKELTTSISDFENKSIYLDGGVDLITGYDNLPSVPIVETSPAIKNSQKEVLDGDLYDIVSDKVEAQHCQLLLFNADLPENFGEHESTKKEDKLAISAYRKSINGSRGRQRYTIVGVTKDLPTPSLSWKKTYSFDFSTLINSVKYYNTKAFGIDVKSKLSSDTISVSQPTQLYKHSNNIFTLQSGCSWEPVSGLNFDDYVLWDVWNEFAAHKDFVWTNMRGKQLPKSCPAQPTGNPALSGSTSHTVNSTAKTAAGSLNLKVTIPELKSVNYLTFLDNDYSLREISKLAPNSLQLNHPVEKGYIQVSHATSEVSLGQTKINVTADLSNVPSSSNTNILSYIELYATDSDNNTYSYPVADSINGSKQITQITAISDDTNIQKSNGAEGYSGTGSMSTNGGLAYTLPPDGQITVPVAAGSYLKYTAVYFDNDGIQSILNSAFDSFIKADSDGKVVITNTSSNTVIIGSLGIIQLGDTSINDIALVHSVGCYEDVVLFTDGVGCEKQEYKKVYFPPADTFCIGMYKITSSSTINLSDITTFYTTPEKNSIVKNALNNLQYRRAFQ